MSEPSRTRMTAQERGAQVLDAAITAFAQTGYTATRTDEIARRAGVSQPYVIRLFGSKQHLFLAALNQVCERIETIFTEAAGTDPEHPLDAMADAYDQFLAEPELPLVLLHGFTAAGDPAIGPLARDRFGRVYTLIRELTDASVDDARRFLATGMLLTVMTALRVVGTDAVPPPWAVEILGDLRKFGH